MTKMGRPVIPESERILNRWKEWVPWATIQSRYQAKTPGGAVDGVKFNEVLHHLRLLHELRCKSALAAGLRWKIIKMYNLDDPRIDDDTSRQLIDAAIERHRTRLGRVKGESHAGIN
jgi:hypothetical protein